MVASDSGFDPRAYEDEVLKPLRKQLPHLPDDLLTRYAVDLTMTGAQLQERVDAVVRVWNKAGMKAGGIGLVCQHLLRDHDELRRAPGVDLASPRWWQSRVRTRHEQLGSEIAELAVELTASYGILGVITTGRLRAAAAAHGKLTAADLDAAREAAQLDLVDPCVLPTAAGTRGQFQALRTTLLAAGVDSIARLLHPQLTAFGLLDGLTVTPAPPAGRGSLLSEATLAQRAVQLDKLPDSSTIRAAKEAVGFLRTEQKAGTDLIVLTLFHLLVPVREKRAEGAEARPLFALLRRTGLRAGDAGRLVMSVLAETAAPRDSLAAVTHLLAQGQFVAAQQLATSLTGPAADTAREAVERRRADVDALRQAASDDLQAGRHSSAGARLREARRLASDLPDVVAELAAVPAAPVDAGTAVPNGGGVRIAWRPAPGHDGETTFRVLRGAGRAPADADDGDPITVTGGGSAVDDEPPVGSQVHYAIFARTAGAQWSTPVTVAVEVVPPVTDIVVDGDEKVVMGRWRAHPGVAAVEVTRTIGVSADDGEPVPVERNRSFRDDAVTEGVQYHYTFVACYPVAGGGVLRSEPVVVRGATRPEVRPVAALTAVPLPAAVGLAVRLSWQQRPGSEIVIRRSSQPCNWPYGQLVPHPELARYGTELDGTRTENGESVTLVAGVPGGTSRYVPFTIAPEGGMRGQDAILDLSEPLRRARAQRFGQDVKLTWLWPDEVTAADVVWPGGQRRITRVQFRDEGGCLLRGVPGLRRVEISAAPGELAGEPRRAPDAIVEVDEQPPQLRYEVRRRGHRLTGGVRCTVTVSGAEPLVATVILVAAAGPVMPLTPDRGVELLRAPVDVVPGVPVVLAETVVPAGLRKPYWLRCFIVEPAPALLIDPPVSQLKVS